MFDPDYATVRVSSIGLEGETFAEIAPLIDALDERFMFVDVARSRFEPPLAGAGPTVLLLVAFVRDNADWIKGGAGLLAGGFLAKMGGDAWDGIKAQFAKAVQREKPESQSREYALLVIQIERVRLVFDETIDEQEFDRRLLAAAEDLKTLPDSALLPHPGPPDDDWYYWNNETQSWGKGRPLSGIEAARHYRDNPKQQLPKGC